MQAIEISYNPYVLETKILINNNSLPVYSSLHQYLNKEISIWCKKIFEILVDELNDDFVITFIGRQCDAEILQTIAKSYDACLKIELRTPIVNISLPDRMKALQELLKKNNTKVSTKYKMNVDFVVPDNNKFISNCISQLDIQNMFCCLNKKIVTNNISASGDYLFSLYETTDVINTNIKLSQYKKAYIVKITDKHKFIGIKDNVYYYEASKTDVFNTIFNCFFTGPLLDCFLSMLNSYGLDDREIYLLTQMAPEIKIIVPKVLELGKSTPIKVYSVPHNNNLPSLDAICKPSHLLEVKWNRIIPLSAGQGEILFFEKGSIKPIYRTPVKVIQVNKIYQITISEDNVTLPIGGEYQLSFDYLPENADNLCELVYESTNENIASITSTQKIIAKSYGKCEIIYTAGKVSSRVSVTVLPKLSNYIIDEIDGDLLQMEEGASLPIHIRPFPEEAIDKAYNISCNDIMIANVVNNTIYALNRGETLIKIENLNRSVKKVIRIKVIKKKNTILKNIFKK